MLIKVKSTSVLLCNNSVYRLGKTCTGVFIWMQEGVVHVTTTYKQELRLQNVYHSCIVSNKLTIQIYCHGNNSRRKTCLVSLFCLQKTSLCFLFLHLLFLVVGSWYLSLAIRQGTHQTGCQSITGPHRDKIQDRKPFTG